jgi:hypothetical protein
MVTSSFCGSAGTLADDEIHLWLWQSGEPVPPRRRVSALARERLEARCAAIPRLRSCPALNAESTESRMFAPKASRIPISATLDAAWHSRSREAGTWHRHRGSGIDATASRARARFFFTAAETEALSALAPSRQGAAFVRLWTCKEAVLKALATASRLAWTACVSASTPNRGRTRCRPSSPKPDHRPSGSLAFRSCTRSRRHARGVGRRARAPVSPWRGLAGSAAAVLLDMCRQRAQAAEDLAVLGLSERNWNP